MTHTVLKVQGMTCQHCVQAVEKSVGKLHGVTAVAVNLANAQVGVEYDDKLVGLEDIQAAIEDAGYDVLE